MQNLNLCRKWSALFLGGIMILLSLASFAQEDAGKKEVARIQDRVVTQEELEKEMNSQASQFGVQMVTLPEDQKQRYRKVILHRLIDKELILAEGKKNKIDVSDAEVQSEVAKIKGQFPDQKTYESVLEQKNITQQELDEKIKENLLLKKIIDDLTTGVATVLDEEVKKYYDTHSKEFKREEEARASHILIKVDKEAEEKEKERAKKKITELREKILKGEDFAKLAQEHSDCPSGKRAGGDLDWFGKGRMVPPFEQAAFSLKVGEISDIVETQFGYHILKVTDRHEAGTIKFEEVKDDLREELALRTKGERFDEWLKKEKEAKVKFTDPADKEFEMESAKPSEKKE
ncbi:peptidylprolyl isomerase [Candidatus Sumerlaeota bacterium]|nr:peptidylprolyl isomerase [Candidatus Sumerlaeota bacterium]